MHLCNMDVHNNSLDDIKVPFIWLSYFFLSVFMFLTFPFRKYQTLHTYSSMYCTCACQLFGQYLKYSLFKIIFQYSSDGTFS